MVKIFVVSDSFTNIILSIGKRYHNHTPIMLRKAETPINSGSPPLLFPYCSAIFPPILKIAAQSAYFRLSAKCRLPNCEFRFRNELDKHSSLSNSLSHYNLMVVDILNQTLVEFRVQAFYILVCQKYP